MPDQVSEPRARLGAELRRVRMAAGRSQSDIGDLHQTVVSRIENGRRLPSQKQAELWLELSTDVDDHGAVRTLLADAQRETNTWSEMLRGRSHFQDEVRDRNAEAMRVRSFQPTVLPGLLQTAEYARRVLELGRTDVASAVAARLASQQLLYEPGRRFEFLVTEDVLRCEVAPDTRAAQMHQLGSVATLDTVDITVVAAGHPRRIPWHNFVIRDPADGSPTYVALELVHGQEVISDPEVVDTYLSVWNDLRRVSRALPGP